MVSDLRRDETRALVGALAAGRLGRREFIRRAAALGLSASAIAAALAACGASPTPTSVSTATPAAGAATAAPTATPTASVAASTVSTAGVASPAAAASPAIAMSSFPSGGKYSTLEGVGKQGGTFVEVSFADAKTTNGMLAADGPSLTLVALLFNALVQLDPDTGLPYPDLAAEVPTQQNGGISADGLTYTFKLRDDVKWSDGQPFTAKDVVFTYTTMGNKALNGPYTSNVNERIASVTAPDDHTVVFKLKKIIAPFLVGYLSGSMYYIMPEHILGSVPVDQIRRHPFSTGDAKATIGTGPFVFKEWVKDDHVTLVKNPTFFRGTPALDQYVFKIVTDANVAAAELKTGEADFGTIAPSLFTEMSKQPNLNIAKYDTYIFTFYAYQLDPAKTTIFQNKAVRQALAYALDRDSMVNALYFGLAEVAQGSMPLISWAYAPDQYTTKYTYDVVKANQMLDQVGWVKGPDGIRAKDGKKLAFTIWTNAGNTAFEQSTTAIQQMWKAIGVDVTPKTEEFNAFQTRITEAHNFEMFLFGAGWQADPDQSSMWSCGGGLNRNRYCNPQVDALQTKALGTLDQAKRKEYYIQMENILLDDLPSMVLFFPQGLAAVNKRVHNMFPNAVNVRWNVHLWWVEDGK